MILGFFSVFGTVAILAGNLNPCHQVEHVASLVVLEKELP